MYKRSSFCAASGMIVFLVLCFIEIPPASLSSAWAGRVEIFNVSYDPTRELFREFNHLFQEEWKSRTGQDIIVHMSHGGGGKQARAVIDGLEADVVTFPLSHDIDALASRTGLLPTGWEDRLANDSTPYTSTIVFLVRKGNPRGIRDWDDLVREDVQVITPNPQTSGGGRWNYLGAWGYALKKWHQDPSRAREFVRKLYNNVPLMDMGARGSTNTFLRGIGDVLLTWENEAFLAVNQLWKDNMEIVVPSLTILAEPKVAVVDHNAEKHGTLEVSRAYLEFLFTEKGQELCAKHYYRPSDPAVMEKNRSRFSKTSLFTIGEVFGGWQKAHETHFAPGGEFDRLFDIGD